MRRKDEKVDPKRSKFGKIEKEEVTMSEKLVDIKAFMMEHRTFSFRELLMKGASKVAVIVTFLVVLELIKTGLVIVEQEGTCEEIYITVTKDPELIEGITEVLLIIQQCFISFKSIYVYDTVSVY